MAQKKERNLEQNLKTAGTVLTIVILIAAAVFMFTGSINVKLNDDSLHVSALLCGKEDVKYEDIEKISYEKDITLGRRTLGIGSFQLQAGNFKNEAYGKYKLYSYAKCKDYIVIKSKKGYLVVNDASPIKTKELYEKINDKLNI